MKISTSIILLLISSFVLRAQSYPSPDTVISVYFSSGDHIPSQNENKRLLMLLDSLDFLITEVHGYTDTVGSDNANQVLSEKRAQYISRFLMTWYAIHGFSMFAEGEINPASTSENHINRRVDIMLKHKNSSQSSLQHNGDTLTRFTLDNLFFEPDRPVFVPASLTYLDQGFIHLQSYPEGNIYINGHVNWQPSRNTKSPVGYANKMLQLSKDRARAMYQFLAEKGIPKSRLHYEGLSNTEMIFPHPLNDEERRKNMRVEIIIVK